MTKRVLLVEPSFYGVDFVRAAKALKCETICIVASSDDPLKYGYDGEFDDLIIADIREANSIYKAIKESPYNDFDALIPCTDYATTVTAEVAVKLHKFGNSVHATQCARNKDLARTEYKRYGVPSAKYKVVHNFNEATAASHELGFPLVLKPTNTASSIDVFFVRNKEDMQKRFVEISKLKSSYMGFPVRQDYLMEEYLSGQEFSVELFLNKDKVAFVEVTEKHISKPPFFVELMHVFPTSVDTQYKKQIISVAYKAAQSLGFHNGPLHIEIKLTTSGPRIVEVNGRPGGDSITSDLIKDAYGINIFEKTIELYLNQDVSITKLRNMSAGIRFIFAPKDGIFKGIDGLNSLKEQNGFKRYEIEKKFGTFVREPTNSDDRLGYYIVEGNSSLELKSKIEEMNKLVTVNIES